MKTRIAIHARSVALLVGMAWTTTLVATSCSEGETRAPDKTTTGTETVGTTAVTSNGSGIEVPLCPSTKCKLPYANCNQDLEDGCEANLMTDQKNCGVCGYECPGSPAPFGHYYCSEGECQSNCDASPTTCPPSADDYYYVKANCDGVLNGGDEFGCEVDTGSDPTNCGGCGIVCAPDQFCFRGVCGCAADTTQCGTVCADLSKDRSHCGACGNVCSDPNPDDYLYPTCVEGQCKLGCLVECGEVDCDNDPNTVCNVLGTDKHCSACNDACPAGLPCMNGKCCDPAMLHSDPGSCGKCGKSCRDAFFDRYKPRPGASRAEILGNFVPLCKDGECYAECAAPYLDCNGDLDKNPTDGCETNSAIDPKNCGACGNVCKDAVCNLGVCATAPCEGGVPE